MISYTPIKPMEKENTAYENVERVANPVATTPLARENAVLKLEPGPAVNKAILFLDNASCHSRFPSKRS